MIIQCFVWMWLVVNAIPLTALTIEDCPSELTTDKYLKVYGDKCYRFEVHEKKTFDDASAYCKLNKGSLVLVKTKSINDFIVEAFSNYISYQESIFWIGLRYDWFKRKYVWQDGSIMDYKNFESEEFPDKECVGMVPGYNFWHNYICEDSDSWLFDKKRHFICEYKAYNPSTKPPDTDVITIANCPQGIQKYKDVKVFGNECYRFETTSPMNFKSAQKYCHEQGGRLPVIKSEELNDFILSELKTRTRSRERDSYITSWIGFYFNNKDDDYVWVDGSDVDWLSPLALDHVLGTPHQCGVFNPNNDEDWWEAHWCSNYHYFVCQYPAVSSVPETTTITTTAAAKTQPHTKLIEPTTPTRPKEITETTKTRTSKSTTEIQTHVAMVSTTTTSMTKQTTVAQTHTKVTTPTKPRSLPDVTRTTSNITQKVPTLPLRTSETSIAMTTPLTTAANTARTTTSTTPTISSTWLSSLATTRARSSLTENSTRESEVANPRTGTSPQPRALPLTTTSKTTMTTPPPATTSTTTTLITTTCRSIICELNCGLAGIKTDPVTGCLLCECNV